MFHKVFRSRRVLITASLVAVAILAIMVVAWTRPSPRIIIEPAVQDLGERPQQHLELDYAVRNGGTAPLHIYDISTSCSCTKAAVDTKDVAPGSSTTLRVTMDPQEQNLYGNLYRIVFLHSNDPSTPKAQAQFQVSIPKP